MVIQLWNLTVKDWTTTEDISEQQQIIHEADAEVAAPKSFRILAEWPPALRQFKAQRRLFHAPFAGFNKDCQSIQL